MGLITSVVTGVTTNVNGNGNGNANAANNGNANGVNNGNGNNTVDPTETDQAVTAPEETQSSDQAETTQTGSNVYYYSREDEAAVETRATVDAGELTLREDEVVAVDFARRAAIATQAKAKVEALLSDMVVKPEEDSAFDALRKIDADADGAYAKADAVQPRYGDKVTMDI